MAISERTGRKSLLYLLLMPLWMLPAFSQETVLSFGEVWEDRESSSSYATALRAYEKSLREIESAAYAGDPEVSMQPGYKTQYAENGEQGQTDLTLSSEISFPLARSALQEEKYRAAIRAGETELMYLRETLGEELSNLYVLYSGLWLLQREEPILADERRLAEETFRGTLELFENGAALAADAEEAEEDLQTAEDALSQNRLDQRIAWFTLQQERGRIGSDPGEEIPQLEEVYFETPLEEKPSALAGRALEFSAAYSEQSDNMANLSETRDRLNRTDWNIQLKPYLSYGDHDWTLSYNWESRNLDLGYDLPLATLNESPSPSSQNNWVTGFNLILTLGTGKADRLEGAVLEEEILRQAELRRFQEDRISLELRTIYQKFLLAGESLAQARTALERQTRFRDAVQTRYEAGQVLKTDVYSAETSEKRSQWKVESARVVLQQTYISLMILLGDLSFLESMGIGDPL